MWKITFILATISVAYVSQSGARPSCESPLRVLRPDLFKHCSRCFYGTWSDWKRIGHSVSSSHCKKSGYAYQVERTRKDNYGKCSDKVERQYECK